MRRLFTEAELSEIMYIDGGDAHHLMHVLRAKIGQTVVLVDGNGVAGEAEIISYEDDRVTLKLLKVLDENRDSPIEITILQCLPKSDKMDFIVQKAVELGANFVQPIRSANCVVRYDAKKSADRVKKWQRIADEAAKQCGRGRLLKVQDIEDIKVWLKKFSEEKDDSTVLLFCYEGENDLSIGKILQNARENGVEKYFLLIGPEGGFSLEEAQAVLEAGGHSVTLGPRILRAETAAVAAMSVVQFACGDLGR